VPTKSAASNTPRCTNQTIAAFAVPHSRVIVVRGTRFADAFARRTTGGELLLIHELLHATGLGESPPAPAEITNTMRLRCGS
jgi:hypothetical protein